MKVIVFDLPASESGALVVLKDFYKFVVDNSPSDIQWTFVVSTNVLDDIPAGSASGRIMVHKYPRIKKNWISRIYFELMKSSRLVRKSRADVVFSLQNIIVFFVKVPQIVYVHQSLPYALKRFSYIRRDERFLAIYADIFRFLIGLSCKIASRVVVQTSWFKDSLVRRYRLSPKKVAVVPASLDVHVHVSPKTRKANEFFYPTTPYVYKNIDLIIKAVALLVKDGLSPKVILTINGQENNYSRRIHARIVAKKLQKNFHFLGRVSRDEIFQLYQSTTLLFPSWLESFGLPLLEGRTAGAPIIATDTPFAREILNGYANASFCSLSDERELALAMREAMERPTISSEVKTVDRIIDIKTETRWGDVINLLINASRQLPATKA